MLVDSLRFGGFDLGDVGAGSSVDALESSEGNLGEDLAVTRLVSDGLGDVLDTSLHGHGVVGDTSLGGLLSSALLLLLGGDEGEGGSGFAGSGLGAGESHDRSSAGSVVEASHGVGVGRPVVEVESHFESVVLFGEGPHDSG